MPIHARGTSSFGFGCLSHILGGDLMNGKITKENGFEQEYHQLLAENEALKETIGFYQRHLEQVIEHHSIEKYRSTVQKNRGVAGTTPQND